MYVEDLLLKVQSRLLLGPRHRFEFDGLLSDAWHQEFIASIGNHIVAGKQLSTKQGEAILQLISRVRRQLVHYGMATDDEIDEMLIRPIYRRPLYMSINLPREVRHLGDNLLGFRFKQNDEIVQRIKACAPAIQTEFYTLTKLEVLPTPRFDWDYRLWLVPLARHNLEAVIAVINDFRFGIDAATLDYVQLARRSLGQSSAVALCAEHEVILANVCDNPLLAGWITEVAEGIAL